LFPNFEENSFIDKMIEMYLTLFFNKNIDSYRENYELREPKYASLEAYLKHETPIFKDQIKRLILQ